MKEQPPAILKDYSVFNPDFYVDVVRFMGLGRTEAAAQERVEAIDAANPLGAAQVDAGELSLKERLNALVDRIEFIGHLELVSRFAVKSRFVILNQEVRGIHWDIKALRLYLALTCIDIFCDAVDHRTHFETVFSNLAGDIARLVGNGLSLQKADGTTGDMRELGLFFYNVRNFYTHSGRRFHILTASSFQQQSAFIAGSRMHKEEQSLIVAVDVDLVDVLLHVAISTVKQRFGWLAS